MVAWLQVREHTNITASINGEPGQQLTLVYGTSFFDSKTNCGYTDLDTESSKFEYRGQVGGRPGVMSSSSGHGMNSSALCPLFSVAC